MSRIGDNLKAARKAKKVMQKDIAKFLGVPLRTYQSYEYGEAEPNLDSVARLAEYLGVSSDYLLGLKNYWTDAEGHITVKTPPDIFSDEDKKRLLKNSSKPDK